MKKYLFLLGFLLGTVVCLHAAPTVYANDYEFQKQFFINGERDICQAVRIHENWFLTSAHCVAKCQSVACNLRIVLAQGKTVEASALLTSQDVFVPKEYQTVTDKGVRTHTAWDVALLHYKPGTYEFRYNDGSPAPQSAFEAARAQEEKFEAQWQGAVSPELPFLYLYSSETMHQLNTDLIVPRWDLGEMTSLSKPEQVLYFGNRQGVWASAGFGVQPGNSGGGVYVEKGGLIGLVTAKRQNDLPVQVKQKYSQFGAASAFFFFNGFSKKTTFKFIRETLARHGAHVKTKELKQVLHVQSAPQP